MISDQREWLAQAKRDLAAARHLVAGGYFEWAAYAAQQAAEKALKAVRIALGTEVGQIKVHQLEEILGNVGEFAPDEQLRRIAVLDAHNAQSRYPSLRGKELVAPFRTYNQVQADDLIVIAASVVDYAVALVPDIEAFWGARKAEPAGRP